jgi:hypothetical protein
LHDTAGFGGKLAAELAKIPDAALACRLVDNRNAPAPGASGGTEAVAGHADLCPETSASRATSAVCDAAITFIGVGLAGDGGFRNLSECATVAVPDVTQCLVFQMNAPAARRWRSLCRAASLTSPASVMAASMASIRTAAPSWIAAM